MSAKKKTREQLIEEFRTKNRDNGKCEQFDSSSGDSKEGTPGYYQNEQQASLVRAYPTKATEIIADLKADVVNEERRKVKDKQKQGGASRGKELKASKQKFELLISAHAVKYSNSWKPARGKGDKPSKKEIILDFITVYTAENPKATDIPDKSTLYRHLKNFSQ